MVSCPSGQMESNWILTICIVHWTCCSSCVAAWELLPPLPDTNCCHVHTVLHNKCIYCLCWRTTKLYSPIFTLNNFHSLTHLAVNVRNFGTSLNEICAFQFKNHPHRLKKSVRKAKLPISQLSKRIAEMPKFTLHQHTTRCVHAIVGNFFAFVKEKRTNKICVCNVYQLDSSFTIHNVTLNLET